MKNNIIPAFRYDFSITFRHLDMIFQYHLSRITPSAAVYGREGCITFHCLQFWRAQGIPFTTTNTSSIDVQGVWCIHFHSQQYGRAGRMVYPFPKPAEWTSLAYPSPPPAILTRRMYPFPPPAVCTLRVYPFPPPAVWTRRVYPFPQPAVLTHRVYPFGRADCIPKCVSWQNLWTVRKDDYFLCIYAASSDSHWKQGENGEGFKDYLGTVRT